MTIRQVRLQSPADLEERGEDRGEQPGHVVGADDVSRPLRSLSTTVTDHLDVSGQQLSQAVDVAYPERVEEHDRGPLLLISGTADHTVPDVVTRSTMKQYRDSTAVTELQQFEGRGHSLTIDHGWREVADATLAWLKANDLT